MGKNISIIKLLEYLDKIEENYIFTGNKYDEILGYSSFKMYDPGTVTWIRSKNVFETGRNNSDKPINLLIAPMEFEAEKGFANCIRTDNPHRVFFYLLKEFYVNKKTFSTGENNTISAFARIRENVAIGSNCVIGDYVEIGPGSRIGDNVVIKERVSIGENCLVQSGAIIGEDGFGFLVNKDGERERVEHLGSVIIGNNVEIGSNTCVVRGVMEDTIIGDGTKIDNLCHIAHNVKIDEKCIIVACSEISGSTHIGKGSWLGPNCSIMDGIDIGEGCYIGLGAVVIKSLPPNVVAAGSPARILREKE